MFLVNSRQIHFSAALIPVGRGHPLSRSYGVMLPSSFSTDHSSTLGFSPRPRVSVYGTVASRTAPRGFSRRSAPQPFAETRSPSASALGYPGGFAYLETPTTLQRNPPPAGDLAPPSLLRLITFQRRYGNIDPFPISYASRPHLRDRLTLS